MVNAVRNNNSQYEPLNRSLGSKTEISMALVSVVYQVSVLTMQKAGGKQHFDKIYVVLSFASFLFYWFA